MKITFGEWLPDQPGVTGAVMEAVNCYPVTNGYAPLRDAADYSDNAGETLLIAFAGKSAGSSTLLLLVLLRFISLTLATQALTL